MRRLKRRPRLRAAVFLAAGLLSVTAMASVSAGGAPVDLPEAAAHGQAGDDHGAPAVGLGSGVQGQSDQAYGQSDADHSKADQGKAHQDAEHSEGDEVHGQSEDDHGKPEAGSAHESGERGKSADAPGHNKTDDGDENDTAENTDVTPSAESQRSDEAPEKVAICHIPRGNPDNAHTINVSERAADAHLRHGDTEGACGEDGDTV